MKVYIHTMYYLPEFGSAPILMDELADYLHKNGHEVEVVTTIPRPPHHKPYRGKIFSKDLTKGFCIKRFRTNFTVHHIGRLLAWTIYTGWTIWNLRHVRKGDVLFLRLPPLQLGFVGFISKKLKRGKILLSLQDIHPDLSIESGLLRNKRAIKVALSVEKWVYKNSEKIVVISEGFRQNLLEKDVDSEKLSIIPNWVDTDTLQPKPKDNNISRKFGFHNKFVLMYSGTISLSSYLTLEKIMEAVKLLPEKKETLLVIVGEGLKKPDLVKKAEELSLENVKFLPFQPYEDLPCLLAASDILLVPLDKEKTQLSVPSKLYNYIAAGRPILATTDEGSEVARIIRDAHCGLYADSENIQMIAKKISHFVSHPDQCQTMGQNARRYVVENYSKNMILRKYEETMKTLTKLDQ